MSGHSSMFRSVRRPPRRRWLRTVKLILAGVLAVALVAVGVVGVIWGEAWLRLGGESMPALAGDVEALGGDGVRAPDDATTVLVAPLEDQDPTAARPAALAGHVALVQVSGQREEVAVVLLPPRMEVDVEGEGSLPLGEVQEQGGLDLLVRGVLDYTNVGIDHVVAFSSEAAPRLTEAVGGVERCGSAGCRVLDGDAVRLATTEGTASERAAATVDVVRGLAARVGPATPLRSPLRSRRVVSALADEVVTDASLRGARVVSLAGDLASDRPLSIVEVPGVTNPDSGRLVVRPEQTEILFQALRQGTALSGEQEPEAADAVLDEVTVAVLNGTGTAGLAGRVESQLQGAGYQVVGTDNAIGFDHEQTVVAYGADDPDAEVAAVLLAEQLGGAQLEAAERAPSFAGDPVDVVVTVGQDLDEQEDD